MFEDWLGERLGFRDVGVNALVEFRHCADILAPGRRVRKRKGAV
jgi:hypothetical protein